MAEHVVMRVVVVICHVSFNLPRRRSSSPSTLTQSAAVTGRPRPSRQRSLVRQPRPSRQRSLVDLTQSAAVTGSTSTQSAVVTGDVHPRCRLVSTRSRSSAPTITSTSSSPPVRRPQVLSRSLSNLGVVSLLLLKPQGCP